MKNILFITVISVLLLGLLLIGPIVFSLKKPPEVAAVTQKGEMCLQGIYPYNNASIQESQAGEYKYEIYATTEGIEVWVECDNK